MASAPNGFSFSAARSLAVAMIIAFVMMSTTRLARADDGTGHLGLYPAAPRLRPIEPPPRPETEALLRSGQRIRTAGIVLTLLGATGLIVGAATVGGPDSCRKGEGICMALRGPFLGTYGGVLLTGAILWPVGQVRIDKAKRKLLMLGLTAAPADSLGASVQLRF